MSSPTRSRFQDDISFENQLKTRNAHSFDIYLFTPELLKTEQGLHVARTALDPSLLQDKLEPLQSMLEALMGGPPNLLEYTVAVALDESRYDSLLSTLQRTFPSSASAFSTSLARALVERLRTFYICLLCPELPRNLDVCHRSYQSASNALNALSGLKFSDEPLMSNPEIIPGVKYKRQSQRQTKHARRPSRLTPLTDSTPFTAIKKDIPRTKEEADELEAELLATQKKLLEEYLTVLRNSRLTSIFEAQYVLSQSCPELPVAPVKVANAATHAPTSGPGCEPEVNLAYPQIQPMKAARYFSEPAEGFGPWNLLLSSRAIRHLRQFHRDQHIWTIIKNKMLDLSQGHFSSSNQKPLSGNDHDIPIYEAKLSRDLRIIYQIDVAPEDETRNDLQVIRLWGIHTHAQMDQRLWKSISQHQTRIGGEYRSRCICRDHAKQRGKDFFHPVSWSTAVPKEPVKPVEDAMMSAEEQLELHSVLALEKFTRMSQALLNNIIADQDAAHPFELTGAEQEIRDHTSSCFVLGRSGTGKTTTMVFKMMNYEMLRIQQAAQDADTRPTLQPRQLFVTQSRILAGRVQEYFTKMMLSHATGHKTNQELERLAQQNRHVQEGEDMLDLDEDGEDERADLPKKFSELEDHHFPLFLTVDQLCKLLEADCNLSFKRRPRTKEHRRAEQRSYSIEADKDMIVVDDDDELGTDLVTTSPTEGGLAPKASIVTFDVFLYAYWPRFPQPLTKGLDPGLVYNEFLGVIKGSEETLDTGNDDTFLDRQTYLNLSERRQSTFSRQRGRIYELFERYNKLKGERGDYDAADRTHAILRALAGNTPFKRKVDYLYVDEAQDNLIIDARLLRILCGNPHGLFWAGDTAQTISMGSSFRFDDLKSFIYRIEERSSMGRKPVQPASFQLDINYRSHAGVVNCAHSVVELITEFWPNTIDALARERGLVDGPRPIFFSGWDPEATSYEQFLFHESLNIELGAQQCILVRNDQAREELRRQIGEVGLVMTLYEAKGLEFNDVLLYNFFSDSTAALSEWRVLLNVVEEQKRDHIPAPRYDETRHASLCSELKSLYVGITRARSHVWILDISEKGGPMRMFWESRQLIQICRPGDSHPKLAVKSTPEQWAQQGHALFKTKHFKHAMLCFERAALPMERSVAHAYLLRQTAARLALQPGHKVSMMDAYLRAAEAFVVCAGLSPSIGRRLRYLTLAADCYSAGRHTIQAAEAYYGAKEFTRAAQHFKRAGLFDEAADVVLLHRGMVDSSVAENCIDIAKLHFHREGQLQKAARLFDDIDDHLTYLEEYGFDNARMTLLQSEGRWADAAELLSQEGRHLDAIPLWLKAGDSDSKRRASHCLLDNLWRTFPLGAITKVDDSLRKSLLGFLHTLDDDLDETQREEAVVFGDILNGKDKHMLHLARRLLRSHPMMALLCFDCSLREPPRMQNDSAEIVSRHLEDYDIYAQLLRRVMTDWRKERAMAVLGLIEVVEDLTVGAAPEFHVLSTSVLHGHLRQGESSNEHITVSPDQLSEVIGQVLGKRMAKRLWEENILCLRTRAFQPCVNFAVTDACSHAGCFREHLPRASQDVESFNRRIQLHMQQVLIVHSMGILTDRQSAAWMQKIWLERLYGAVFPSYYSLGHVSALVGGLIPEYQRALRILADWIRDRFYSLKPYPERAEGKSFLTELVQTATLALVFDRDNATHYIRRAECVVSSRPPSLMRKEGYIVHDLLNFLEASHESAVATGALFIKHVVDNRIPIDVDTLLNVIESVFSRAIIESHNSLHQITLPRSWIVDVLSNRTERVPIGISALAFLFKILSAPLRDLLEAIYSNQRVDRLTYDRRPLSQLRSAIGRNVLAFRICRCMTLLGYNYQNPMLRDAARAMFNSLNKQGRMFPPLIIQYVKAERWSDLARAARLSTDSPLDELFVMCKDDKIPAIYSPPRGVKLVRYRFESDILPALVYKKANKFNPEAVPFVPKVQAVTSVPEAETVEEEPASEETFNDTMQDVEVTLKDLSIHRTEAEIDAAKFIQKRYRGRLALKKAYTGTGGLRSRIFVSTQEEAVKLTVTFHYRHMFLGPLPHALTALQGCALAIAEAKKEFKKRFRNATAVDLDRENELITTCNALSKEHSRLWRDMQPTSKLHLQGSSPELKQRVERISDLFQQVLVMNSGVKQYAWDMDMGYKGIVRVALPPRPTAKTAKRPALNTEDFEV